MKASISVVCLLSLAAIVSAHGRHDREQKSRHGSRPWRPQHAFKTSKPECDKNDGPLILTPYINSGQIQLAQQLSEVDSLHHYHRKSYSGYFTVNVTDNSNMFFWFFPAEIEEPADAPVILWLQGVVLFTLYASRYFLFLYNNKNNDKKLQNF